MFNHYTNCTFFSRICNSFLKNNKWFLKSFNLHDKENLDNIIFQAILKGVFLFLIGFFVGAGHKIGDKLNKEIELGESVFDDHIKFIDGTSNDIRLIGKNSCYIFYLIEGNKEVQISPISGVIKTL